MSGIVFDSLGPDYPTFPQFQKALREYEAMLRRAEHDADRMIQSSVQTGGITLQNVYQAPQPLGDGTVSRIVVAMSETDDTVYTERAASPRAGDLFVIDHEVMAAESTVDKGAFFRVLRGREGTMPAPHAKWSNIVAVDTLKKA